MGGAPPCLAARQQVQEECKGVLGRAAPELPAWAALALAECTQDSVRIRRDAKEDSAGP